MFRNAEVCRRVKTTRQKRRDRKAATNERFSELEKDNAARMARLQDQNCTQTQEKGGERREIGGERVRSGLGDWQDDGVLRRRGSGGSLRSYKGEEGGDQPPRYEEAVRGR